MSARINYLDRIKDKLTCVANNIKRILPEDFHDQAIKPSSISDEEHRKNSEILSSFAEKVGIMQIFTAIIRDGRVYITSISKNEKNSEDITPFFQEFFGNTKLIKKSLMSGKAIYSNKEASGTIYSIYLPEKTEKGRQFVIYAGIDLKPIRVKLKLFFWRSFIISCIFIILAVPFMIAHVYSTKEHIEAFQDLHEILHNKTTDRTAKMDKKIKEIINKKQ
jgi:hypothetical protein